MTFLSIFSGTSRVEPGEWSLEETLAVLQAFGSVYVSTNHDVTKWYAVVKSKEVSGVAVEVRSTYHARPLDAVRQCLDKCRALRVEMKALS